MTRNLLRPPYRLKWANLIINSVFFWWNSCIRQVFNNFVKIWLLFHLICGIKHFWFEVTISHCQVDFCGGPDNFCRPKYYRFNTSIGFSDIGDLKLVIRILSQDIEDIGDQNLVQNDPSATSQICHQHISSLTSVTNIDIDISEFQILEYEVNLLDKLSSFCWIFVQRENHKWIVSDNYGSSISQIIFTPNIPNIGCVWIIFCTFKQQFLNGFETYSMLHTPP